MLAKLFQCYKKFPDGCKFSEPLLLVVISLKSQEIGLRISITRFPPPPSSLSPSPLSKMLRKRFVICLREPSVHLLPPVQIISIVQLPESLEVGRQGNFVFHEFSSGSQTSAGPGIFVS